MDITILIIDGYDAPDHTFEPALEYAGFQVECASGLTEGFHEARTLRPDLIILNLFVPDTAEWNWCRDLHTIINAPVMIIAECGSETVRAKSLYMGADDYQLIDISPRVLLARIRALLRRATQRSSKCSTYCDGTLTIDLTTQHITLDGQPVSLTPTEFRLLSCLLENIGDTLSHRFLLRQVWKSRERPSLGLLRLYIRRLRQKIEPDSNHPRYLQNSHSVGYCFHDLRTQPPRAFQTAWTRPLVRPAPLEGQVRNLQL